ncbi:recombinase family protein [Parasphingorhabdus cellanae]|uniref:Recombinase family protein n=1 Tax=Parasphingorhabdus cellanae TaxID=2806553 RepID=A0ABX7T8T7_9SPHN|nr:recombinase family protein [Parasphingorhabdus cellanae]QTD57202.1 recombinase family protein [Parasphingorhabdus cellanae]
MPEKKSKTRCAIYTRKSTEDGLEQAFNSLDAQRDACAAYILSQTHEGWEGSSELYDDGGFSGGSMKRPGLEQLLQDVKAGKVDVIVVYKVDRLTRSLADFAKIVEILDEHGASFVSVTQSFNTTTSMGRLTLNVLLSFAQFEREVTGERIRDKIAASKKKGMWMGGPVPIGYDLGDRKLLINHEESKTVQHIFKRYTELRSVPQLVDELARQGYRTKIRTYKDGRKIGGVTFYQGPLAQLLKNPIYVGKVRHKDEIYDGEHDAIIEQELFDQVQAIFASNRNDNALGKKAKNPSLLTGLITDPDGRSMTPCHASRGVKRYRYYVTRFKLGEEKTEAWRLPSNEIERLVTDTFAKALISIIPTSGDAKFIQDQIDRYQDIAYRLLHGTITQKRKNLLDHHLRVQVRQQNVELSFKPEPDNEPMHVSVDAKLVKRGSEVKLAIPPSGSPLKSVPNPTLQKLVAQAFAAQDHMLGNKPNSAIAHYSRRYLGQLVRISWLAPDIIAAIMDGTQPSELTGRKLTRVNSIPLDWPSQRKMFGFT